MLVDKMIDQQAGMIESVLPEGNRCAGWKLSKKLSQIARAW